ncbi:MAG: hypothetical protein U0797_25680 [Gemmataceae bacterium]
MPIRFRCPHCDQLLGIARRKAGAHVRCPSCRRDVAVPAEDEPSRPDAPALPPPVAPRPGSGAPALFEQDDFEQLLHGSVGPSVVEPPRNRGSAVRTPAPGGPSRPAGGGRAAAWAPALDPLPPGRGAVAVPGDGTGGGDDPAFGAGVRAGHRRRSVRAVSYDPARSGPSARPVACIGEM